MPIPYTFNVNVAPDSIFRLQKHHFSIFPASICQVICRAGPCSHLAGCFYAKMPPVVALIE